MIYVSLSFFFFFLYISSFFHYYLLSALDCLSFIENDDYLLKIQTRMKQNYHFQIGRTQRILIILDYYRNLHHWH